MLRSSSAPCIEAWPEKARLGGPTGPAQALGYVPERAHRPRLPALLLRREAVEEIMCTESPQKSVERRAPRIGWQSKVVEPSPKSASQTDKRLSQSQRHAHGKSIGAGGRQEKPAPRPEAACVASPARRRSRRKTWTAPPTFVAEGEEGAAGSPQQLESEPGPATKSRSLTWASDFLMLGEETSPKESPAAPVVLERKHRRCKTWAEPPQPEAVSPSKESPKMTSTVSLARRHSQRCKTWSSQAQISPAGQSTTLGGSLSPGTSPSLMSSFGDGGLHTPGTESLDCPLRIGQGFKWKQGEKIGSGSYGCVYKALDKETGLIFAVKKALVEDSSDEDKRYRDRLERELDIYKELNHLHVVSYLGHDYSDSHLYIYLAYVSGGSLASFLSEFGPITGRLLQIGSRGLVEGLSYLHSRSPPIVHRDIKGGNVLVDSGFCLKLADFGCSKRDVDTKSFTTMGSIPWMAPEVIQQKDGFGRKADVWSLGCTVIEMASADKPWGRDTFDNMMFALRHIALTEATPPIPESLPHGGKEFIGSCVQRVPGDRPSAFELLREEFIVDVPSQAMVPCNSSPMRRARDF